MWIVSAKPQPPSHRGNSHQYSFANKLSCLACSLVAMPTELLSRKVPSDNDRSGSRPFCGHRKRKCCWFYAELHISDCNQKTTNFNNWNVLCIITVLQDTYTQEHNTELEQNTEHLTENISHGGKYVSRNVTCTNRPLLRTSSTEGMKTVWKTIREM
jgi:hypothetical protein